MHKPWPQIQKIYFTYVLKILFWAKNYASYHLHESSQLTYHSLYALKVLVPTVVNLRLPVCSREGGCVLSTGHVTSLTSVGTACEVSLLLLSTSSSMVNSLAATIRCRLRMLTGYKGRVR